MRGRRFGLTTQRRAAHTLSHVSSDGSRPQMVDVGGKKTTRRTAWAQARVCLPSEVANALESPSTDSGENRPEIFTAKGPVFTSAIIAGVMAAKRTSETIPFCHPLPLDDCQIRVRVLSREEAIDEKLPVEGDSMLLAIDCHVAVTHKTGVEMEALTGASSAALCIYDMCKALSHDIVIQDVRLMEKTGGKRHFARVEKE